MRTLLLCTAVTIAIAWSGALRPAHAADEALWDLEGRYCGTLVSGTKRSWTLDGDKVDRATASRRVLTRERAQSVQLESAAGHIVAIPIRGPVQWVIFGSQGKDRMEGTGVPGASRPGATGGLTGFPLELVTEAKIGRHHYALLRVPESLRGRTVTFDVGDRPARRRAPLVFTGKPGAGGRYAWRSVSLNVAK